MLRLIKERCYVWYWCVWRKGSGYCRRACDWENVIVRSASASDDSRNRRKEFWTSDCYCRLAVWPTSRPDGNFFKSAAVAFNRHTIEKLVHPLSKHKGLVLDPMYFFKLQRLSVHHAVDEALPNKYEYVVPVSGAVNPTQHNRHR